MELQRTTHEKKKCAKEAEIDIPITQFAKGGTSQPKTTPVKSASITGQTSISVSLISTTSVNQMSLNAGDDEDEDPEKDKKLDNNNDKSLKSLKRIQKMKKKIKTLTKMTEKKMKVLQL
jgi:hypothetical protein